MSGAAATGQAQTVLGPVAPAELGITSMHEHILFDMSVWAIEPTDPSELRLSREPVSWENVQLLRANRPINADNMRQQDVAVAIAEVTPFKDAGGGTIVELSQHGMSRDPAGLAEVARATGVNVVMGSGYYVGASHPQELERRSVDDIAEELVRDLTVGVGETGIRAGIIGELGCSIPLEDGERKVLQAGAIAQQETGAPLNVHPSFSDELVLENVRLLADAGADLSRVVISHVDQNDFRPDTWQRLAEAGCYLELDSFGHLGYPHLEQGRLLNLTSDLERIRLIEKMIAAGYERQILVGLDICFKDCLTRFGGFGYAHLVTNVMRLMRLAGLSDEQIDEILVENPKRLLTIA